MADAVATPPVIDPKAAPPAATDTKTQTTVTDTVTTGTTNKQPEARVETKAKAPEQTSLLADPPKADEKSEPAKVEAKTEPEKPADQKPVEWKLEAPKDSGFTADHIKAVESWAKEAQLSPAQAQAVLEREAKAAAESKTAQAAQYQSYYTQWAADADKAFGAQKAQVIDSAKRALAQYGDDDFRALLNKTPYGNFPPLMRFLAKVGDSLKEDGHPGGTAAPPKKIDPVRAFYGDRHSKR